MGLSYVDSWGTPERVLLDVLVDPMFVGAAPHLERQQALRAKEYFAYGVNGGPVTSIYHSSTYAAMGDEWWKQEREKIAGKMSKQISDLESDKEMLYKF